MRNAFRNGIASTMPMPQEIKEECPPAANEIPIRINRLTAAVEDLSCHVAELRSRIAPVSRATSDGSKNPVAESRTPLGAVLADSISRIELITMGVAELIEAVEL